MKLKAFNISKKMIMIFFSVNIEFKYVFVHVF